MSSTRHPDSQALPSGVRHHHLIPDEKIIFSVEQGFQKPQGYAGKGLEGRSGYGMSDPTLTPTLEQGSGYTCSFTGRYNLFVLVLPLVMHDLVYNNTTTVFLLNHHHTASSPPLRTTCNHCSTAHNHYSTH